MGVHHDEDEHPVEVLEPLAGSQASRVWRAVVSHGWRLGRWTMGGLPSFVYETTGGEWDGIRPNSSLGGAVEEGSRSWLGPFPGLKKNGRRQC